MTSHPQEQLLARIGKAIYDFDPDASDDGKDWYRQSAIKILSVVAEHLLSEDAIRRAGISISDKRCVKSTLHLALFGTPYLEWPEGKAIDPIGTNE